MTRIACLLGLALPLLAAAEDPLAGPIRFPPRPRLLYTPASLQAFRADPARAPERTRLVQQADRLKDEGLTIPDKEGNWYFYYACPEDGSSLKAEAEYRHVCPVCKRVLTDERTAASYRTILYRRLEGQLKILAQAYALTDNPAYAEPVRDAMLKMARAWPTFTRHDRWGRSGLLAVVGGRRFGQLLDEANSLIQLAESWDLIADAPCLAAEDRALIEKQLFRMPVGEIDKYEFFVGSRNNHQAWFNAAKAVTGLVLGDEALLRLAFLGKAGLLWQLDASVTQDGLWYEGTMAYHFYAVQAIVRTLEAADRVGWNFSDHTRLKSLWLGPLQMAYPNGQCPVFHDSDPARLDQYKNLFEWGAGYFHEPSLTQGSPAGLASTNLAGIGVAVLRRGAGAAASCLMLDYGLHGDHHGHPDKLNVVLYALGRELLLDPGRISYRVPEYQSWCRTTVAHNTVVVDARDQRPDTGQLLFFADTPAAAGALAISQGAYPGATLRRFVVLADDLLIDAFSVRDASLRRIDWIVHGRGALASPPELRIRLKPLGEKDGYLHLTGLKDGVCTNPPVPFTFTLEDGSFWRLWGVNTDFRTRVVTGAGIGYRTNDAVPFVLQRREAEHTLFLSVFDLSGRGAIASAAPVPVLQNGKPVPETEACAVRIASTNGTRLVALDLDAGSPRSLTVEGQSFSRWLISEESEK